MMLEYSVKADVEGERVDKYLSEYLEDLTRNRIQKLMDDRMITVNGKEVKSNYKLEKSSSY